MNKFNKLINDIKTDDKIPDNVRLATDNALKGLRTNAATKSNSNSKFKSPLIHFNKLKIAAAIILVMLLLSAYLAAPILMDNNAPNNVVSNETNTNIATETQTAANENIKPNNSTETATKKTPGNSFYVVAYANTNDKNNSNITGENNSASLPDNTSETTVGNTPDSSVPANNSELIFYGQEAHGGVNGFCQTGLFKIAGNNIKTVEFSIDRGAIFRMTRTFVSIEEFNNSHSNYFNHDPNSTNMYTSVFDADIMMHIVDYHELLGNSFVESYNSELYYGLYITDEMTNPESSGLSTYEGVTVYDEYDGASITFRVTFDDGTVQELTYKLAYDPLYFLPNPGGSYSTDLIGCVLKDNRLLVHRLVGRLVEE